MRLYSYNSVHYSCVKSLSTFIMLKVIWVFILIFFIQGCLCLTTNNVCPEPETIEPCECYNDLIFGVTLRCQSFSLAVVVERAINNSRGYNFDLVIIGMAKLEYIPHTLFEVVKIKELRLEGLRLDQIFDRQPIASEEMKKLALKYILVNRGSPWEFLQPLKSIRALFVEGIRMEKIGKGFSHYATKDLQDFYFEHTETETIETGTFDKFENIRLLSISTSSIANLTRDMFPTPFNVKKLSFDHQKITKIEEGLFSSMPNLAYLSLIGNLISTVPETAFDRRFTVEVLMLDDNPIKCDCGFKWFLDKNVSLSGTCESPKKLHGERLDHLSKRNFGSC